MGVRENSLFICTKTKNACASSSIVVLLAMMKGICIHVSVNQLVYYCRDLHKDKHPKQFSNTTDFTQ